MILRPQITSLLLSRISSFGFLRLSKLLLRTISPHLREHHWLCLTSCLFQCSDTPRKENNPLEQIKLSKILHWCRIVLAEFQTHIKSSLMKHFWILKFWKATLELFRLTLKHLSWLASKTFRKRLRRSLKSTLKLNSTKLNSFSLSSQANRLTKIYSNVLNSSNFCLRWRKVSQSPKSIRKTSNKLLSLAWQKLKQTCNRANGSKLSDLYSTSPNSRIRTLFKPPIEFKASSLKLLLKQISILHLPRSLTRQKKPQDRS